MRATCVRARARASPIRTEKSGSLARLCSLVLSGGSLLATMPVCTLRAGMRWIRSDVLHRTGRTRLTVRIDGPGVNSRPRRALGATCDVALFVHGDFVNPNNPLFFAALFDLRARSWLTSPRRRAVPWCHGRRY